MLGLCEAHAVILGITMLVWEDNHEVLARVVFLQFIRQTVDGILVGDSSLTGTDHHKEMVVGNLCGQLWQFIPMSHRCVFCTY